MNETCAYVTLICICKRRTKGDRWQILVFVGYTYTDEIHFIFFYCCYLGCHYNPLSTHLMVFPNESVTGYLYMYAIASVKHLLIIHFNYDLLHTLATDFKQWTTKATHRQERPHDATMPRERERIRRLLYLIVLNDFNIKRNELLIEWLIKKKQRAAEQKYLCIIVNADIISKRKKKEEYNNNRHVPIIIN